jgi:hypothetical protein
MDCNPCTSEHRGEATPYDALSSSEVVGAREVWNITGAEEGDIEKCAVDGLPARSRVKSNCMEEEEGQWGKWFEMHWYSMEMLRQGNPWRQ